MKVKLLNLIPDQDNEFRQIHVVKMPAQGSTDLPGHIPRYDCVLK